MYRVYLCVRASAHVFLCVCVCEHVYIILLSIVLSKRCSITVGLALSILSFWAPSQSKLSVSQINGHSTRL